MSNSNRGSKTGDLGGFGVAVAIILCCLIVGFLAYSEGYKSERYENSSYEYAQAAKDNAIIACSDRPSSAVADCVYDQINSSQETSNSEQDLQAQQWMARWAFVLVLITLGTTLISWLALRYLRDTFRETAKAVKATKKATKAMIDANEIAERANRPWITMEVEVSKVEVINNHLFIDYRLISKNIGKSCAYDVCVVKKDILFSDHIDDRIIENWFAEPEEFIDKPKTIIPEDFSIFNETAMKQLSTPDWSRSDMQFVVLASVRYSSTNNKPLLTQFSFVIGVKTDPEIVFDGRYIEASLSDGEHLEQHNVERYLTGKIT